MKNIWISQTIVGILCLLCGIIGFVLFNQGQHIYLNISNITLGLLNGILAIYNYRKFKWKKL